MSDSVRPANFLNRLDRVVRTRQRMADQLSTIAETLTQSEFDGEKASGKLELEREIEDIVTASKNLRQGVFRLLVLGDMKRGKSTFLNALIGENLLPSDVNPCTALLTILKYGPEKKVTIYFRDGKPPERIDFKSFKQRYTIEPEAANKLEQKQEQAFPEVSHAVIEYPLALLGKGVEIVDSPGLNDTEARNELSLGYIHNCHAILFVLRASQPCTLAERRYLENYIKDRGLSVFFLVNAWDQVKKGLIDPDNTEELAEAEAKLRKVFRANLAEYCQVDGVDVYDKRVFEISAISALRRRIKDPNADLAGTGFGEFVQALNIFLTQEQAISELQQARTLARQTQKRVREAVARRILLLEQNLEELKQRIASVEPQFTQLNNIQHEFRDEIRTLRDRKARAIADSFKTYILRLEYTFEQDFLRYQPEEERRFFDFLGERRFSNERQREEFDQAIEQALLQYVNDKFCAWTLTAQKELTATFNQFSASAEKYGAFYIQVTDQISEKLAGPTFRPRISIAIEIERDDDFSDWATDKMCQAYLPKMNVVGIVLAICGICLVSALQENDARQQIVQMTKQELVKYLPQMAQEQWQPIYSAVQECFDAYEREVIKRMKDDIQGRKAELNNLVKQKESHEINRTTELARLQGLENTVAMAYQALETEYQSLLAR